MNTQNGNNHEQANPLKPRTGRSRAFRLRRTCPRVTRLSRKVLAGGSAVALFVIGELCSDRPKQSLPKPGGRWYFIAPSITIFADGITTLPKDYAGVATPSHPATRSAAPSGDLGRPILAARGQSPTMAKRLADAEQQRRDQETEAAHSAICSASTNGREVRPSSSRNAWLRPHRLVGAFASLSEQCGSSAQRTAT